LEDLGLAVDANAGRDATELVEAHRMIRAFVDRRRENPEGSETTQLPSTKAVVWNLHFERLRGLTWHDEEADVIWLLGVGYHESGSVGDAYAVLKGRDAAGELMPGYEDYSDLEPDPVPFVERLAAEAPILMARARVHPGREVREILAATAEVGVQVEVVVVDDNSLEEIWISITQPPVATVDLPPSWVVTIVAALLPEAQIDDLKWGGTFPRPGGTRSNEVVVSWER
jgi:hypothetical protein